MRDPIIYRLTRKYRDMHLWEGWGRERFYAACQFVGLTPQQMAAACAIHPGALNTCLHSGHFPSHIALLFHMLEEDFKRSQQLAP